MLTIYHGSTCRVEQPLARVCRPNLDFGVGFYLTDLKSKLSAGHFALLIFAMKLMYGLMSIR